jgi:hypothetical protein
LLALGLSISLDEFAEHADLVGKTRRMSVRQV